MGEVRDRQERGRACDLLFHNTGHPVYLLMVYAKARREDMSADEKKQVRQLASILKDPKPSKA